MSQLYEDQLALAAESTVFLAQLSVCRLVNFFGCRTLCSLKISLPMSTISVPRARRHSKLISFVCILDSVEKHLVYLQVTVCYFDHLELKSRQQQVSRLK